jgi:TrmH family RNA methyltransferase
MLSKAEIKRIRSLHLRKFREKEGCYIVEGPKLVDELLKSEQSNISIYHTSDWHPPDRLHPSVHLIVVAPAELAQLSSLETPNKVLAVSAIPKMPVSIEAPSSGLHLLLDRISDPGNLGTIIRIADWFGVDSVCCSLDTVELHNPKVIQSTMGSIFRVSVHYASLPELLIKNSQGPTLPVFAAELGGAELYEESLSRDGLILLGNESRGLNPLLLPFVTKSLRIPAFQQVGKRDRAESLNVAVATGIICAEFRRRFK